MKTVYVVMKRGITIPIAVFRTKYEANKRVEELNREGQSKHVIETRMINDELYSDIFRPTIKFN